MEFHPDFLDMCIETSVLVAAAGGPTQGGGAQGGGAQGGGAEKRGRDGHKLSILKSSNFDMGKVRSTLRQYAREW